MQSQIHTCLYHCNYYRYMYYQGNEQTTKARGGAATRPWLIIFVNNNSVLLFRPILANLDYFVANLRTFWCK